MVRLYSPEAIDKLHLRDGAKVKFGVIEFDDSTLIALPRYNTDPTTWPDNQPLRGGELIYRSDTGEVRVYDSVSLTWSSFGGTSDHGSLSGLSDDDHTIYIKADGTRAFTGDIDFDNNQSLNFRVENRTSDPASPAVGQVWLRTDL